MIAGVAKESLLYFGSSLLVRGTGLITLPIVSRILTPEDYGSIAYVTLWSGLLTILVGFGHEATLSRFYLENADPESRRNVANTWFAWSAWGTFLILSIMLLPLYLVPVDRLPLTPSQVTLLTIAIAAIPFQAITTLCGQILRAEYRATTFAVLSATSALLSMALAVFCVAVLEWGAFGVLFGALAGAVVAAPVSMRLTGIEPWKWPRLKQLRSMLEFGLPLALSSALYFVTTTADRFMLEWLDASAALGYMSVAIALCSVLNLLIQSFVNAWLPRALEHGLSDPEKGAEWTAKTAHLYLFVLGGAAVALSVCGRPLMTLLAGPEFRAAWQLVPLLSFATFIYGVLPLATLGMQLSGRTTLCLLAALGALPINLLLAYTLIPAWGMFGAAAAFLLSQAAQVVFAFAASRKVSADRFSLLTIANIAGATASCCALAYIVPSDPAIYIIAGLSILALYVFMNLQVVPRHLLISTARRSFALAISHDRITP